MKFDNILDAFQHMCHRWEDYPKEHKKADERYYKSFMGYSKDALTISPVRMKKMLQKAGYIQQWHPPGKEAQVCTGKCDPDIDGNGHVHCTCYTKPCNAY